MADNWDDDDDDDWDKDSDEEGGDEMLKARMNALGLGKQDATQFDDEEDLAVVEKENDNKAQSADLKKKGNALAAKKQAEQDRKDEEEIARKAMELEAEMESNMSPDELRVMKRKQAEEADNALTDDLFGNIHQASATKSTTTAAVGGGAGGPLVLKDLKDHLKHARKVSTIIKQHGKVHLAAAFLKEAIQECKDVLDDAAISDIIKTCNVIKNDMVQASKRKVKYQAQKSAKRDKTAEKKALALNKELYGDNDEFDDYDKYGEQYEDAFF